jgi:hypothetical protein
MRKFSEQLEPIHRKYKQPQGMGAGNIKNGCLCYAGSRYNINNYSAIDRFFLDLQPEK